MPVVGRIAAGSPILAEQSVEDVFPLAGQLVGEGTLFLLKVAGDSMINAAIADGDMVVVRQQGRNALITARSWPLLHARSEPPSLIDLRSCRVSEPLFRLGVH